MGELSYNGCMLFNQRVSCKRRHAFWSALIAGFIVVGRTTGLSRSLTGALTFMAGVSPRKNLLLGFDPYLIDGEHV